MKATFCFLLILAFVACVYCEDDAWEQHKEEHGLHYENVKDEQAHKAQFLKTLELLEKNKIKGKTRAGEATPQLRINSQSHLTKKERRKGLFGLINRPKNKTRRMQNRVLGKPVDDQFYQHLPFPGEYPGTPKVTSLDWLGLGVVQPSLYTQNPCGSCWAFTGVAVLEAHYLLRYGKKIKLSEQFVRDCAYDSHYAIEPRIPCQGAFLETAMQLASEAQIPFTNDYKYKEDDEMRRCPYGMRGQPFNITGIAKAEGELAMMSALRSVGPLGITMDADEIANSDEWFNWNGQNPSMYLPKTCTDQINHAVTLIGYGTDARYGNYWVIRNSWGPDWGNKGTFKIPRNTCGITYGVYPCFDGKCHHSKAILPPPGQG